MKYKIGDQVRWVKHPENEYAVMATRETPSLGTDASYAHQRVEVPAGFDYYIVELNTDVAFDAWQPALENDLSPL